MYEVLGLGALRTRLQVAAHRGLARFVGRHTELERLHEAMESVRAGHGKIVGVVGEAGVGKSRLFHEFKACSHQGCMVLETFSVSHGKAFPYLPLIDLLRNYFQITAHDDERLYRERVTGRLLTLDRALEEQLPYLLFLLGISEPSSVVSTVDATIRRQRTFEAVARLLVRESQNQPLMVLFEDLQWLDSETEAFLNVLIQYVPDASLLLLVNYRPEYAHEWVRDSCYTQLHLEPLGQAEVQGLLTVMLGDHPSLDPLKLLIQEKTEGNPFFMEEVVRTLAEENVLLGLPGNYRTEQAPMALHIPTTVQGVLAARIDRLSVAQKELLQSLAIIGKEFSLSLIKHVTALPDDELRTRLGDLQAGDFIYECPAFPEVEYAFKHALTQEVAGNSLLTGQRSVLHERTASSIEALFPGRLKDYCCELAYHYSKSGNVKKAIEYLRLAGEQALQRSAQLEAIHHLSSALQLLKSLPDTPERAHEELTLQLTLGPAWMAARGYGAPEVEATYTRALELSEQGGETPQFFSAQLGLWSYYLLRAQFSTAQALAERLLSLARDSQEPEQLAEAHRVLGATVYRLGEIRAARAHVEQALALHDPERQPYSSLLRYARNPAVHMQGTLSWILWHLGFPDQSRACSEESLSLARHASDPFALGLSLVFAAELRQYRREAHLARGYADAVIALSSDQGFPLYLGWGKILRGWALAAEGSHEEGIAQMHQGLSAHEAIGAALHRPRHLALLADAYGRAGQAERGLRVLDEALTLVDTTGERFDESMLLRLKGELMLLLSSEETRSSARAAMMDTAETCFQQAVAVAHEQGARSFELQGAMSLARLWQGGGKLESARWMLAGIYGVFAEGFDTVDLQEAKALLADLK
ncbi:TOMM system kinase/cyclase fusion protein [compost metagenome]